MCFSRIDVYIDRILLHQYVLLLKDCRTLNVNINMMLYFRSKSTLNVEIMAKCKITVWYFILFTCVYALQNDTVWTKYRCSTSKLRFLTIQSIVLNLKSQDKFLQDDGHFQPIYIANHHSSFLIGLFKITKLLQLPSMVMFQKTEESPFY